MTITFSVIIPTRNGAQYIAAALESVLKQTYPPVQVIVLESGSTDRTLELVTGYDDPRVQVYSSPDRLGIEGNWARIMRLELDGYMTILGHDDVLYPNFCEEIARLIRAEPDASLYGTHFHFMDAESNVRRACVPIPYRESAAEFMLARHHFQRDSNATGYVMRAADYRQVGGFPPFPQLLYADDITWYRLSKLAYKVCSPAIAFAFRQHTGNASHQASVENWYHAARGYYQALAEAGYMSDPIHRQAARQFIEFGVNGQMHHWLVNLIAANDPAQIAHYHAVKKQLLTAHNQTPMFTIYDKPTRLYESVLALPEPVRKIGLRLIRSVRALRRWRRRQRATALNH